MLSLLARGMGRCGAVAVCLQIVACSLQNFDALSSNETAGNGGSAGRAPSEGGNGADGGRAPIGGRGGTGGTPAAGSGGQGSPRGGAAGVGGSGTSGRGGAGGSASNGGFGSSPSFGDGGVALNLLPDPSFAVGHAGWSQFGTAVLADAPGEGKDGSQCLLVSGRTQTFAGPAIDLQTLVVGGQVYGAEAWVRTSSATTQSVSISIKTTCTGAGDVYTQLVSELVAAGEWLLLRGEFTAETCALDEYVLYIEGPEIDTDIYVDDVGLYRLQ